MPAAPHIGNPSSKVLLCGALVMCFAMHYAVISIRQSFSALSAQFLECQPKNNL